MQEKIVGIYQIKNILNEKVYIGQSKDCLRRRSTHFTSLRKNKHINIHLQHAWNKHGEQSFVFEILTKCEISELSKYEQSAIDKCPREKLYNLQMHVNSEYFRGTRTKLESELLRQQRVLEKSAKLTPTLAKRIKLEGCKEDSNYSELARKYNVCVSSIVNLMKGRTWKNILPELNRDKGILRGANSPYRILTDEQIKDICENLDFLTLREMAERHGLSEKYTRNVRARFKTHVVNEKRGMLQLGPLKTKRGTPSFRK